MKAVVQRVQGASVTLRETGETREIGLGFVVLLGITHDDTAGDAEYLADRILGLRVMADEAGKINLALKDVPGSAILVVSQFTLYGDAARGRRPSFVAAAPPAVAIPLYEHFLRVVAATDVPVKTGEFGADMMVQIQNDGPVTLILESPAKG